MAVKGLTSLLGKLWVAGSIVTLTACFGGGGGGENDPGDPGGNNQNSGGVNPSVQLSFNVSNAKALVATEDTVTEAKTTNRAARTKDGRRLFTYKIVDQGISGPMNRVNTLAEGDPTTDGTATAADGSEPAPSEGDPNAEVGTNLLAVDEEGNTSLAIESNYPVKVMYSVADPTGQYVYLALDPGWWGGPNDGGKDYTRFIAENNCAFYKVTIADNSYSCVMNGVFVQYMDDQYMQSISGNQKPIQFDKQGNVYFTGTTFNRQTNTWTECCDENGQEYQRTDFWIDQASWNARIYRADSESGEVTALTQDTDFVSFFLALPTGEIAYQSWNEGNGNSSLYLWQNGSTIALTDTDWGVSFFTGDTNNAVIWGTWDWQQSSIFFARPRGNGLAGVEKTKLNTELFGANRDNGQTPTPRRVIVGDDGRLYGVFESWRWEPDQTGTGNGQNILVLSVYQMLPFDAVPKVQLELDNTNGGGWWDWMGATPFQVSQGYLFYVEQENVPYLGDRDVIKMVNLEDRSVFSLLNQDQEGGGTDRYEIYSWRLSGTTLYFSALDLNTTTVVTGEIDTVKVRDGETDYLTLTETASAAGAVSAIKDIEVLKPVVESENDGSAPTVVYHTNAENLYSVSMDFSQYMDKNSVESNLGFTDPYSTDIETMKIWIEKTLHLIPDLSDTTAALGDKAAQGLNGDTTYDVSLSGDVLDIFGNPMDMMGTVSNAFTTRPDHGWYISTESFTDIADGKVAKYAGAVKMNEWDYVKENFEIASDVTLPADLQIEFSAKNVGNAGVHVLFWNQTVFDNQQYSDPWQAQEASIRMGDWGWSNLEYKRDLYDNFWKDGPTPELFNGSWARYRIKLYGTNLKVMISEDGTEFTEISTLSVDDMRDRTGSTMKVYLGFSEPMAIDNIVVSSLNANGSVAAELESEDFNTAADKTVVEAYFGTAVDNNTIGWW